MTKTSDIQAGALIDDDASRHFEDKSRRALVPQLDNSGLSLAVESLTDEEEKQAWRALLPELKNKT